MTGEGNHLVTSHQGNFNIQPLIFGVYDTIVERVDNTSLAAGIVSQDFSVVVSGQIEVITVVGFQYVGTAPNHIDFVIYDGSSEYIIGGIVNPTQSRFYAIQGQWVMQPGWLIRCYMYSATLNDDLHMSRCGYTMKVNL